jgi:predicted DNA-binding transcriptional regulator YafY
VSDTAERLLRLLGLLQRRPSWSGDELAEHLGVGVRTVRRDAERLRELGYAVDTTPGPHGGYRLGVGADMPPLMLDDDEAMAVAVLLGISAGAAIPGIERPALAALARVDRVLPPRLRAEAAALRAATVPLMSRQDVVPAEYLVTLARACDSTQRVVFGYRTRQGDESERRAEPHWLVATDRRWYLVAHDLDRDDWRTFRVDRMSAVRATGHTFEPRTLEDPAGFVNESISIAPYLIRVIARFALSADEMSRLVAPGIGVVTPRGPAESTVELGVDTLEWAAGYLVGLGVPFEVESPTSLRRYLAETGRRLTRSHRGPLRSAPPADP